MATTILINGKRATEVEADAGLRTVLTEKMMARPNRTIHQLTGTIYAVRDEQQPLWRYYSTMY